MRQGFPMGQQVKSPRRLNHVIILKEVYDWQEAGSYLLNFERKGSQMLVKKKHVYYSTALSSSEYSKPSIETRHYNARIASKTWLHSIGNIFIPDLGGRALHHPVARVRKSLLHSHTTRKLYANAFPISDQALLICLD